MNPTAELLTPEVQELIRLGQYSDLREALHHLHPADVAEILAGLEPKEEALGFRFLQRDDAAAAFSYLAPEKQEELINVLGNEQSVRVLEAMSPDDLAKIVDELPEEVAQRVVASLSPESRKVTQAILGYPERSVGRLMTPDYIRIKPDWTAAQTLDFVRKHGRDAETINVLYVVDDQGRLIDDMRLRPIILAAPNATIESLMTRSFVTLRADQDREEAVRLLTRYDRTALPVVDSRGALIGIVTHDDVADVAQMEATEDIQKLGGMGALESPYVSASHMEMFRKRGVWLGVLFVGQIITILVLGAFQSQIAAATVLVLFMPLVISCGGNSGSQAATLVTRALALAEITPKDWLRIVRREIISALLLGAMLGVLGFACASLFTRTSVAATEFPIHLSVTVALSIIGVVLWGTILGSLLPLLLKRFGIDPAVASSPMVATLMDASGTLIYLGAAILLLSGKLL